MKPQYQINDFIIDPDTHKDRWQVYKIKHGGMGWVYIVYDHIWKEPFAVKTYKNEWLQTKKAKEDFKKEALIWINLDKHENITYARMIKEIHNRIYLFLEYIAGGDLSQYIGTKILDVKQIIKFALQFCYGMEHAVTHGINVHRDIKHSNCLITKDKILKITDFGLAKALDSNTETLSHVSTENKHYADLSKTKTGQIGGTPYYMAPEQFNGIKHLDIRSDIYSFGVMLYEMISGKLPFYGSTWSELKENHQKKNIPNISEYLNKKESSLANITYKCLAKHLNNRYRDFNELKKDFTNLYKLLYNENHQLPKKGKEFDANDLLNKGESLRILNHHQEAIKYFNKALSIDSKLSQAWNNKGAALIELSKPQEAIKCFNKALEIDPKFAGSWCNKGTALGQLNHNQQAIACFNKALEIDPNFSLVWNNKGITLINLNHFQEAIKCFNKALEINPKYEDTWYNKGATLVKLNKYIEAIKCYDKALEFDPDFKEALYNKGLALVELNYTQEAVECYTKTLEIDPKFRNAWYNKGTALGKLGHYKEEIECYTEAIKIDPRYIDAWYNKGVALGNLGNLPKVLECFQKAKELGDPNVEQIIASIQQHLQQKDNS